MAEYSAILNETTGLLARTGPDTAASFYLYAATPVKYTQYNGVSANVLYTDTLPALTPAILWGTQSSTPVTAVDISKDRYVLFTVPVHNGAAVLYMTQENNWGNVTKPASQNVIGLYMATYERWWAYQASNNVVAIQPPGGSWSGAASRGVFDAQSWSGAASRGVFDAQSWSGGASVSGVSSMLFGPTGGTVGDTFGLFVIATALPTGDTTIGDHNFGSAGFFRTKLTAAGHVVLESVTNGVAGTLDLSTVAIPLNQFCWCTWGGEVSSATNSTLVIGGLVFNGSGVALAPASSSSVLNGVPATRPSLTGILGVGNAGSGNYLATAAGGPISFSKLRHVQGLSQSAHLGLPVPSADVSGDYGDYMARQPTGAATQVTDTSANALHLLGNVQIAAAGPYA